MLLRGKGMVSYEASRRIHGFYFITPTPGTTANLITQASQAVRGGAGVIQYRDKHSPDRVRCQNARVLKKECRHALFIVNDRPDIALASGADGVHLGAEDMAPELVRSLAGGKLLIGVTVRDARGAAEAERCGADYVSLGPVYPTHTKSVGVLACGPERIGEVKKACTLPIVAIGGITRARARAVVEAGADALCAIAAVCDADFPEDEVRWFASLF